MNVTAMRSQASAFGVGKTAPNVRRHTSEPCASSSVPATSTGCHAMAKEPATNAQPSAPVWGRKMKVTGPVLLVPNARMAIMAWNAYGNALVVLVSLALAMENVLMGFWALGNALVTLTGKALNAMHVLQAGMDLSACQSAQVAATTSALHMDTVLMALLGMVSAPVLVMSLEAFGVA